MESMVNKFNLSIYKGKRVFVTGHTGFKGTWLCALLQVLDAQVAGFSLEPNTDPSHFRLLSDKENSSNSTISDILNSEILKEAKPELLFLSQSYKNYADKLKTSKD